MVYRYPKTQSSYAGRYGKARTVPVVEHLLSSICDKNICAVISVFPDAYLLLRLLRGKVAAFELISACLQRLKSRLSTRHEILYAGNGHLVLLIHASGASTIHLLMEEMTAAIRPAFQIQQESICTEVSIGIATTDPFFPANALQHQACLAALRYARNHFRSLTWFVPVKNVANGQQSMLKQVSPKEQHGLLFRIEQTRIGETLQCSPTFLIGYRGMSELYCDGVSSKRGLQAARRSALSYFENACEQVGELHNAMPRQPRVSFHIESALFYDHIFRDALIQLVQLHFPTICCEMCVDTHTALFNAEISASVLTAFQDAGFTLAVRLPPTVRLINPLVLQMQFSRVYLDSATLLSQHSQEDAFWIARSLATVAHNHGKQTVLEGVSGIEDREQFVKAGWDVITTKRRPLSEISRCSSHFLAS